MLAICYSNEKNLQLKFIIIRLILNVENREGD